jgi:uncharacterized membrane protein YcaP (DUF421 family)
MAGGILPESRASANSGAACRAILGSRRDEMVEAIRDIAQPWLGLGQDPKTFTTAQVCLRGLLVFFAAIAIVRVADKRFLSRKTAFDAVLAFTLASMLARAINGSAAFGPSLACGFALVLTHRLIAHLCCRWHFIGALVKGHEDEVIRDGEVDKEALRKHNFTDRDLMEDLRLQGVEHPAEVKTARLERSGDLSVIKAKSGGFAPPNLR